MSEKIVKKVVDKAMDLGNFLRENVFGTQMSMGALSENPKVKAKLEKKYKTRDESKRIKSTKKFANGGKVDFKGTY